jgi:hypothetical protein
MVINFERGYGMSNHPDEKLNKIRYILYFIGALFLAMGLYAYWMKDKLSINALIICSLIGISLVLTAKFGSDRIIKIFKKLFTSW